MIENLIFFSFINKNNYINIIPKENILHLNKSNSSMPFLF